MIRYTFQTQSYLIGQPFKTGQTRRFAPTGVPVIMFVGAYLRVCPFEETGV
jgi:hypothetical protein